MLAVELNRFISDILVLSNIKVWGLNSLFYFSLLPCHEIYNVAGISNKLFQSSNGSDMASNVNGMYGVH